MSALLSPTDFEAALRAIGAERYHDKHPFHRLLHGGKLNRGQVQAWALNRYVYQAHIPIKDAALIARCPDAALRKAWRSRLADHDGDETRPGGIARWLKLTAALGLNESDVTSMKLALPGTIFAVEAYVHFVAERSLLEAVASSLTELFAPTIIAQRVDGMLANYDFVDRDALAYFTPRLTEAPQDSAFALAYCVEHAKTPEQQTQVIDALKFKCGVLWSMLDALHVAYVEPSVIPPGAFVP
ncbi:Bifunctional coenzyme PQQ synthesis protein C/D [Alphaproteobacteria bacterium SO-S41]|nr:Bifunctional coenzyme PQQ synthesis protein C/D [Alphaproteobacteria bacterium SO-S41]